MSTPIADMVKQMLAAGTPHDMIVLAVATAENAAAPRATCSGGISGGNSPDPKMQKLIATAEKRRLWDRNRKRKQAPSADTTAAGSGAEDGCRSTGNSTGIADSRALSLSSPLKKESQRERRARAKPRPVETPVDWQLSAEDERFAADRGFTPADIADVAIKYKNHRMTGGKRGWQSWAASTSPARSVKSTPSTARRGLALPRKSTVFRDHAQARCAAG
jgi:hypothetical protein